MRDLILALEAIELKVGGTITTPKAAPGAEAGPPLLDLTLESDRFEPSQVLSLFPATALPELQLAGYAQLGAQVRGPANAPAIDGELEIDGVSVTPPGRKQPLLTGLQGEARFTRTTLSLSPLTGQFAMSPFKLTATVTNFARPEVKGALDLTAKVTDLAALATLPPGLALDQGKLAFDVDFATKAPKFAEALQMEGTVRGDDIAARLPNWPVPIRNLTFIADLAGRGAVIEPFQLSAGRSDVGGRVVWPRFDAPAVEADLRSRFLDLDELAPTAKPASPATGAPPTATAATGPKSAANGPKPAAGRKSAGSGSSAPSSASASAGGERRSGVPSAGAPPLAPAARGTLQATAVRWQKLTTEDVRCRYALDQRGLTVEDLSGGLLGGTVQGSLAVDLAEPDSVRYRSNLQLTRVQADELVTTFTPAKHILYGELDSSLDLAGILAGESPPLALLSAIGDASVRNGYLAARGSLAVIMRAMGLLSAGERPARLPAADDRPPHRERPGTALRRPTRQHPLRRIHARRLGRARSQPRLPRARAPAEALPPPGSRSARAEGAGRAARGCERPATARFHRHRQRVESPKNSSKLIHLSMGSLLEYPVARGFTQCRGFLSFFAILCPIFCPKLRFYDLIFRSVYGNICLARSRVPPSLGVSHLSWNIRIFPRKLLKVS